MSSSRTSARPARARAAGGRSGSGASARRVPVLLWVLGAGVLLALIAVLATSLAGEESEPVGGQFGQVTVEGQALPTLGDEAGDGARGLPAPVVSGTGFDGTPVTIGGEGEPTVVLFLAHWCPHCQRELPRVVDWMQAGGLPEGARIVAVTTSTSPDRPNFPPEEWLADEGYTGPVLVDDRDSTAAAVYGLSAFPFFTVLDGDGTVVARSSGEADLDALTRLLENLTES